MPRKSRKDYEANRKKWSEMERAAARRRYEADPTPRKEVCKRWWGKHREEALARRRANRQKNPSYHSDHDFHYVLKKKYGMTGEEYQLLLEQQGGVCAICGLPERVKKRDGKPRRLGVDHDHDTGLIRGLLCHFCNSCIGMLTEKQLEQAVVYLRRHRFLSLRESGLSSP